MKKLFWFIVGWLAGKLARVLFNVAGPAWRRHERSDARGHGYGPMGCCQRLDCRLAARLEREAYAALYLWRDCPASWR